MQHHHQQQQQKYPQEEQQQQQQQQQMGFNGDGGGGGGGGGGESNHNNNRGGGGGGGGGLTRFWSAPSTWLDSLVQDLEIPPSQNHCLPQLPTSTAAAAAAAAAAPPPSPLLRSSNFFDTTTSSGAGTLLSTSSDLGFLRQNSSPAELLDNLTSSQVLGSDGYLPSFGGDFNYNLSSSSSPLDFPTNKRTRESEFHQDPSKFSPQLKGEPLSGVNSFSDMEMEKLFEDSVPCRVRAKRGCATHPRSIAERVRRTRISDRIRKLQELVPNMDKQTNTADMLEEAVEYVKVLQKQIKELSEHQQNCTCLTRS